MITHPILWMSGIHTGMPIELALAEIAITLVEAAVLKTMFTALSFMEPSTFF